MKKLLLVKTKIITISFLFVIASICFLSFNTSSAKKVYAEEIALPTASDTIIEVEEGFELCDEVNIRLSGNAMKFSAKVTKEFHEEISDGADEITYFATMNVVGSSNVKALEYGVQPDFTEVNEYNLCSYLNFEGASQNILDIALKTEFESGAFVKVVKGGQTTFYKAKNSNEVEREMRVVALDSYLNHQEGAGYDKEELLYMGYFTLENVFEEVTGEMINYKNFSFFLPSIEGIEEGETIFGYINGKKVQLTYTNEKFNCDGIRGLTSGKSYYITIIKNGKTFSTRFNAKEIATEGLSFGLIGDKEYSVIDYTGNSVDVYVPNYYNDKPVTSIGEGAFNDSLLERIELPNNITNIGYSAFSFCKKLTSVEIPKSVTSIGEGAFNECISLEKIIFAGNSRLITIGANAFNFCYALTTCEIPSSVTSIGDAAFQGCRSLTGAMVVPEGITKIGNNMFYDCSKLETIEIPSSVTSIGYQAFEWCRSLETIEIPSSVTSIGDCAFDNCYNLKTVTFGENSKLESIGHSAFYSCSSLGSIEIPSGVTSIGERAFDDCELLETIDINENNANYKSIDGNLYSKDGKTLIYYAKGKKATNFIIPNGIINIANYAFYSCSSLETIEIPSSVTSIGDCAFQFCLNLETIIVGENSKLENIGSKAFDDCDIENAVIPSLLTDFISKNWLRTVVINGGATINAGAFYSCSLLESVELPNSITYIGDRAFSFCNKLTSVEIPKSVTYIGDSAFSHCALLTNIAIPKSVTNIGTGAFNGCSLLASIEVDEENLNYKDIDGNLYTKDGKTLMQYAIGKKETSFAISNGVVNIDYSAFFGCSSLTSIYIPNSVENIGSGAFSGCSSLTNIYIPNSVESIGTEAFSGCLALKMVVISDSVWSMGSSVFRDCYRWITIYCELESLPGRWSTNWNECSDSTVLWAGEWEYVDGVPTKK